jgi:ribosomal protein L34
MRLRPESSTPGTAPASSENTSDRRVAKHQRADGYAKHSEENAVAKGKRTFQPNNRRRARVHGFRLRMRTRAGRSIVSGRRRKGRRALTA